MDWLKQAVDAAAEAAPQDQPEARPTVVSGRTLLVDADYLAYYAAGNDETDPGRARQNALEKVEAFKVLSGCERVVQHCTSQSSNKGWRFLAATVQPYQGQRDGGRKPKNWRSLRDWMETYRGDAFKVKMWTDREADDGMAYHSRVLGPDKAVIATADKDMRMFAGIHIDWKTYDITVVAPGEFRVEGANGKLYGHAWFWQQMLQGDRADNIPGLPGYIKPNGKTGLLGEKTAAKFIDTCNDNCEALSLVARMYGEYYGEEWADRLVEQAALLWMRDDREASIQNWLDFLPCDHPYWEAINVATCDLMDRIETAVAEVAQLESA